MATLAVKDPTSSTGVVLTPVEAAAEGDQFANSGKELLLVENGSVSSVTVTIERPTPSNYGIVTDVEVTVAAGATTVVGPFPIAYFNDENGFVQVSCSSAADVDLSVIRGR